MPPQSDSSRFWVSAEVFLAAGFVLLPAAFGGAPEWTSWLLWFLAAGALASWMAGARRNHRRWGWHPALLVPLVLSAVVMLQLLPLPPPLLKVVSPRVAELREFALIPLGLTSWRPLAVDSPAAWRGLARLLSLGMLFFVAMELGRVEGVRRRLFAVLALSGTATALCGFIHLLAGMEALFGVVHFYGVVPFLTPFGNTNHLAAWLTLTGTVGLGLALKAPTRDAAIGWGVTAAICAAGVFFSFSRGGIASLVATWGLVALSLLARRAGGMRGVVPWAFIGGTLLVAVLLSFEQLVERAESLSTIEKFKATKVDLWPMFAKGLEPYWALGMGPGGFELGFAPAQTREFTVSFTHPEAFPLQWAADFGVPLALLGAAFALWLAWRLWSVTRPDPTANVALLALAGVALHDVFDFALELNATSAAACVVVGLLCSMDPRGERLTVRRRALPAGLVAILGAALALVVGLPGFQSAEHDLQAVISERRAFPEVRGVAVGLIDRHPADWVLYAAVAGDASQRSDPRESLAWVNRVLFLRPYNTSSHLAAANALLRLDQPLQALGEYKLAWAHGEESSLGPGLALAAKLNAWDRVLLEEPGHLTRAYGFLRNRRRDDEARTLLDAARLLPPSEAVKEEAELLAVRHEADLGSADAALAALDALEPSVRDRADLVMARVQVLTKLKRLDEAVVSLERLLSRHPSDLAAGFALIELLSSTGRTTGAREVLQRIRPFAASGAQRSAIFQREASLWMQDERYPRALDALQTASRIEPQSSGLHYRMAEIYERMGSLNSAIDEIRKGRLLDTPEGARSRDAWLSRLEAALGSMPVVP